MRAMALPDSRGAFLLRTTAQPSGPGAARPGPTTRAREPPLPDTHRPGSRPGPTPQQPRYDLRAERDACGIGFVADARGRASRDMIETAIHSLCRVRHRGALASDAKTGDGAGLLLP